MNNSTIKNPPRINLAFWVNTNCLNPKETDELNFVTKNKPSQKPQTFECYKDNNTYFVYPYHAYKKTIYSYNYPIKLQKNLPNISKLFELAKKT